MGNGSQARGWFTPEGEERFEIREALPGGGATRAYRARDRVLERNVLVLVGSDGDLEGRARVLGRLEHPGAIAVYATGRDPEGRFFLASADPLEAEPLSALLPKMTREEALRVVLGVAHAVNHASSRGVPIPAIDPERVLRFPDGEFRVVQWDAPGPDADQPHRAVQKLLRRAIVPFGPAPREIWKIVTHPYESADALAKDLAAYLDGTGRSLAAGPLPWRKRVGAWARHYPGRATLAAGAAFVALVAGGLATGAVVLVQAADRRERDEAAAREAEIRAEALALAKRRLVEVGDWDAKLATAIHGRREMYHSLDALRPTAAELELDDELARLELERTAAAQRVLVAAGDLDVPDLRLALVRGELEHLFARAAFEESKRISTLTIPDLRKDPIEQEEHPYHIAASRLAQAGEFADFEERLRPVGTLSVGELPPRTSARLREGGELVGGEVLELEIGEHVIEVRRGSDETFVFDLLIERGEVEDVDPQSIPDARAPEGYVWIPAGEFYRGGYGTAAGRYRRSRVERPFLLERQENAHGGNIDWEGAKAKGTLPTEEEWEYAARGAAGRRFPWGDKWVADAPGSEPDRSVFGVELLAGSRWEWTSTPSEQPGRTIVKGGYDGETRPDGFAGGGRSHIQTRFAQAVVGFRLARRLVD